MNSGYALIAFVLPILPVVAAVLLFVPGTARPVMRLAPWLPLTAIGLLPLHGHVAELPWLLLGARIGLDDTALPLFVLAIVVWTLAGLHAAASMPAERRPGFFFFWLMTWTGNLCVFITLDAASFYAAYATLTFSAYGLIIHWLRPQDFRAGRVYLVMALIGEGLIIAALLTLGSGFGNVPLEQGGEFVARLPQGPWVAVLFALGFGVKLGLVPLHMWLPLAHPRAPVPASAVLSGVIVKAGLIGWLRFLPLGFDTAALAGWILLVGGVLAAFYAVVVGLPQTRAKTVLAYSTISQMGLLAMLVGLALLYPEHAPMVGMTAGLFALHHGLAKAALFLSVDIVKSSPAVARALMWLPALALAGAPLTSGALAKTLLKAGMPTHQLGWLEPVLVTSSVATTLLLARFLAIAWPGAGPRQSGPVRPWLTLVAAVVLLPWLFAIMLDPGLAIQPFGGVYLLSAATPVATGIVAAAIAARLLRGRRLPTVPEGDLIALFPDFGLRHRSTAGKHPARVAPGRWTLLDAIEARFGELAIALLLWFALLLLIYLSAAWAG